MEPFESISDYNYLTSDIIYQLLVDISIICVIDIEYVIKPAHFSYFYI